jgi:hypothetical protein
MRNLAVVVVAAAIAVGGYMGCGGTTTKLKAGSAGTAGGDGGTGTGGYAGSSAAGTLGTAGDASVAGAAGTPDGAAGMTPTTCDTVTKETLPYNIESDFTNIHTLNNTATWTSVVNPNCDQTIFPPLTQPSDGGIDGDADAATDGGVEAGADAAAEAGADAVAEAGAATEAGADAGAETPTLDLDAGARDAAVEDGPGDAAVVDARFDSVADAGADAVAVSDSGSDAKAAVPACYEFTYDPDACVTTNGGVAASAIAPCWSGVIFETATGQPGPGICIASGAMHVSFEARASRDGAIIKFGSIGEGLNTTEFYTNITTSWATYTTAIPATADYNSSAGAGGVWNGFSVVAEPQSHIGGTYIFVRNIQWVAQ